MTNCIEVFYLLVISTKLVVKLLSALMLSNNNNFFNISVRSLILCVDTLGNVSSFSFTSNTMLLSSGYVVLLSSFSV